ncbi:MAG: hypothetical protein NTX29_15985 [Actinobacteria bacterium]|nr:hypothetical protein [Actinomycetota bacterium]
MRIAFRAAAVLVTTFALIAVAAPAQAQSNKGITTVTVYHQPVTTTSVTGSGLDTVRTFFAPTAVNGKAADSQYLTGTLTTITLGMPGNQEVRAANLIFVFGSIANQLVVGGASLYPAGGATLEVGAKMTRPVIGGSGIYAGAAGEAISTNLGANGWTHVFKIRIP